MRLTLLSLKLSLVLAFVGVNVALQADQAKNERMARAYYFEAESAVSESRYPDALAAISQAEALLGTSNASTLAVRVKIYFGQGNFPKAKLALDRFFDQDAGNNLMKQMAPYMTKIDAHLSAAKLKADEEEKQTRERVRLYLENDLGRYLAEAAAIKKEALQIKARAVQLKREATQRQRSKAICLDNRCNDGFSVRIHPDGSMYDGDWYRRKPEGTGEYFFSDGSKYEGQHVAGRADTDSSYDDGTMYYKNGNKYVGKWTRGKRLGRANYYFASGKRIRGEYSTGGFQGDGTIFYANGTYYRGNLVDSKPDGSGTIYYANGAAYVGGFSQGKRSGEGTFYNVDGTTRSGLWDIGEFQQQ